MKLIEEIPGIIQIDFDTQYELTSTFVRMQEHYESPEFKDKIFTLGQFRDWYSRQKGGFTYYKDWAGFNIPKRVVTTFRGGLFDPLTYQEQELLRMLPDRKEEYYVIGTFGGGEDDVLDHEIFHGLYHIDEDYKTEINKLMGANHGQMQEIYDYLEEAGYHAAVWWDEAHAYIGAHYDYLKEKKINFPEIREEILKAKEEALKKLKE